MIPVKYSFILKHNIKEISKLKSQIYTTKEEMKKTTSQLQLPMVEPLRQTQCKYFSLLRIYF